MKITIEISDEILQMIVDEVANDDIEITIDDLKKNPNLVNWFQTDIDTVYLENFEEGLANCDVAGGLDLE